MAATLNSSEAGGNLATVLKQMAGQIIAKMGEIDHGKDELSDMWAAAKDAGIDVKALRTVIAEMRDSEKFAAHLAGEEVVDRYRAVLGLYAEGADATSAKVAAIAAHLQAKGINVKAGAD